MPSASIGLMCTCDKKQASPRNIFIKRENATSSIAPPPSSSSASGATNAAKTTANAAKIQDEKQKIQDLINKMRDVISSEWETPQTKSIYESTSDANRRVLDMIYSDIQDNIDETKTILNRTPLTIEEATNDVKEANRKFIKFTDNTKAIHNQLEGIGRSIGILPPAPTKAARNAANLVLSSAAAATKPAPKQTPGGLATKPENETISGGRRTRRGKGRHRRTRRVNRRTK